MDSDPISDSPVKRQKTQNGYRTVQQSESEHGQHNTIPTQPLMRSQYDTIPTQPLSRPAPDMTFSRLMSEIAGPSSPSYVTQPTQLLNHGRNSSTPAVQVERSSPPPVPSSPDAYLPKTSAAASSQGSQLKRPGMGSRLAPAGTIFRKPQGTQPAPARVTIDLDDDEDDDVDPPIQRYDSDDESQPMRSMIKPTEFTKGGRGLDSSPNRVQESPRKSQSFKDSVSQFAFTAPAARPQQQTGSGDMSSAYGNVSRNKPIARQNVPSRAQPIQPEKSLDDIFDFAVRRKIERMLTVLPGKSVHELEDALSKRKGNYDDAVDYLLGKEDVSQNFVDLTSSDIESGASKAAARPIKPSAKQEVKAPIRSIQEKYLSSTQAKAGLTTEDGAVKRKRLMQGRKNPTSPTGSPSPQKPAQPVAAKKRPIVLDDSDSEANMDSGMGDGDSEVEEIQSDFDSRLLNFFNTCSVQELADLSNEKEKIAELILSKRPFRNLDAISSISNAQPNKIGKRAAKKLIGEKILDICTEMWQGYEAVDELVEKCDKIGKPITEAMKQWGIDVAAAAKDGELALTKLEDSHDSGIGTPSSSTDLVDDEDIKSSKAKSGKTRAFLKQPANMSTELMMKDYQLFGLNWLNLLWSQKLSCILADDMGLGKTCQVISFLAHLKETGVEGTHLVVVPGSTLENWIRELNRFCPDLNVSPYYGSQKEREEQRYEYGEGLDEIDVIVTTYETAVSKYDLDFLRKVVRPTVCVFDEGHALKNHQSKRHQQLMRIPAKFRLLLTGTPLQNNLQELVSLLAFILPDIFNTSKREDLDSIFKYKASTKDDDHAALLSAQRIRRARSMMTPFILRRKKQQVLRHMPAKHRRVEYCDMAPGQRDLYKQMVSKAVEARDLSTKGKGGAQATQHMTRLRQAALHPLLLQRLYSEKDVLKLQKTLQNSHEFGANRPDQIMKYIMEDLKGGDYGLHRFCLERSDYLSKFTLKNDEWMDSGKVHKLQELLQAYVKNGDKILIFSQFTTMMDILEAVFETLSIKFMRLDGSTQMATRQDIIDQFSTDASIPVFMLSTKAGGAGINLACANKVIIFDSSFNPQDDIQAENRAHRVGQLREVEVVRLVTRGTIEEQIHALGESKLALDDRVAGADGDAGAEKKADAEGEKMVQDLFFKHLEEETDGVKKEEDVKVKKGKGVKAVKEEEAMEICDGKKDLKDEFKDGLKSAGLNIKEE